MAEKKDEGQQAEAAQAERDVNDAIPDDDLEGHSVEEGEGEQNDTIINTGCC